MNEILLEQIPNLSEMLRNLEQLSFMKTEAQVLDNPFIMEQLSSIRANIQDNSDWQEIAAYQKQIIFTPESEKQDFDQILKIMGVYDSQAADALTEGFKCENCKRPAENRCSRCKSVWYCSRECQVGHYKTGHKQVCKQLASELNKLDKIKREEITIGLTEIQAKKERRDQEIKKEQIAEQLRLQEERRKTRPKYRVLEEKNDSQEEKQIEIEFDGGENKEQNQENPKDFIAVEDKEVEHPNLNTLNIEELD